MKTKSLNRLIAVFVLLEPATLLAFGVVAYFLAERSFRGKSEVMLVSLRNDYIRGDLRSLHKQLQTAVSQHQFLTLGFKEGPLRERTRTLLEHPFLDAEEFFPVLANVKDPRSQISEFVVRYSLAEPLVNALILWGVFSILLFSFVPILRKNLQRQIRWEQEQHRREREYQLARQVAHDIRSPIMALKMAAERIAGAEQEKELIVMACTRMSKIAEDLLVKSRLPSPSPAPPEVEGTLTESEESRGFPLVPAIREVLAELQMQTTRRIELNIEGVSEELRLSLDRSEFQRAMVNLINNSLEATAKVAEPEVQLSLRHHGDRGAISLFDNGVGIPEEVLGRLGQRGVTHGKENGNGLGLHHAKSLFETAGGHWSIQSRIGVGTLVTIQVPARV